MHPEPSSPAQATRDHLRPTSLSGGSDAANCVAACAACNSVRGRTYAWTFHWARREHLIAGLWPACTWARPAASRRFAALGRAERARYEASKHALADEDWALAVSHDGARYRLRLLSWRTS